MAIVARILYRNWIVGPVWLQMLALELANVGRQPRPPSLLNRNKRRCRRAVVPRHRRSIRRHGLRRASCRGLCAARASACLPSACAQRVCTAAWSWREPSPPPPPIHSGPWVQVGVSAFRFRSAIHGGHF